MKCIDHLFADGRVRFLSLCILLHCITVEIGVQQVFAGDAEADWCCEPFVEHEFAEMNEKLWSSPFRRGFVITDGIVTLDRTYFVLLLSSTTKQTNSESVLQYLGWKLLAVPRTGGAPIVLRPLASEDSQPRITLLEPMSDSRVLFTAETESGIQVGVWDLRSNRVESIDDLLAEKRIAHTDIPVYLARNRVEPFASSLVLPKSLQGQIFRNRFLESRGDGKASIVFGGILPNDLIFISASGDTAVACLNTESGEIRWKITEENIASAIGAERKTTLSRWTAYAPKGFKNCIPLFVKGVGDDPALLVIGSEGKLEFRCFTDERSPKGSPLLSDDQESVYCLSREFKPDIVLTTIVRSYDLPVTSKKGAEFLMMGLLDVKGNTVVGFVPGALYSFSIEDSESRQRIWTLPQK